MHTQFRDMKRGVRMWLARQSPPVEVAIVTAAGAAKGAAIRCLMGTMAPDAPPPPSPPGAVP
ncbi:hypothetical protein DsansV1_C27g0199411 [Dioscorea sansibarensis]